MRLYGLIVMLLCSQLAVAESQVTLVANGQPRCAIYVPPALMDAKAHPRVAASVQDLATYLEKVSGAKVEIHTRPAAANDGVLPILIGDYAVQRFGPPVKTSPFKQGWRVAVTPEAIGLFGESDEGTSYAIYEVLDRIGCRWYMPGELGEVIPSLKTIQLPAGDVSDVPATEYRGIWYGDADFTRRNRMGGFKLEAQHALEHYITKKQRAEHPEWAAVINGKPHRLRLKWSRPDVADAIADAIIAKLDKKYQPSISLSPEDGIQFDESDDRALDAGDWDPTMKTVSITDRYIVLANRIAERVTQKYPHVRFGFLAYVQYTRPPVREKLHPNLVPQIAPITYCRAHAMTDGDACPSRASMRQVIEGWGKAAQSISYYNYMYHLAEVSAPYPMIRQMCKELPIVYANRVAFWQPETLANFESVLPGLWLTIRRAWNRNADADEVLDEFFTRFYGAAAQPMRRYWQVFDDAWTQCPAHAGGSWSYARRFTPEVMARAREAMNAALAVAQTPAERSRVRMHADSLGQFERFLALEADLREGRFADLDQRAAAWHAKQAELARQYAANYAFTAASWPARSATKTTTVAAHYFRSFNEPAYLDAARIAREGTILTKPLRSWRYAVAGEKGVDEAWLNPDFDDSAWKTTDVAVDRWADLGLMAHLGTVCYRTTIDLPAIQPGKTVYLWIPATDGRVKVLVNGQPATVINPKTQAREDSAIGYCEPFSFDITAAAKPGTANQITILGTRETVNELGSGGLMGAPVVYTK